MSVTRYAAIVCAAVALTLGSALAALGGRLEPREQGAAVLGAALAAINSVAAYYLLCWSMSRSNVAFFRAVLGGMLGRMVFLLAAVAAALTGLDLPAAALTTSLVGYFAALLVFELTVASRGVTGARTQPS